MEINHLKEILKQIEKIDFVDFRKAPESVGIYLLHKKRKLVYIGSSLDLKRRLKGLFSNKPTRHVLNKRVPKGYYKNCLIKILAMGDINDARAVEYFLIARLKPLHNR